MSFACVVAALFGALGGSEQAQLDFASTIGPDPKFGTVLGDKQFPISNVARAKAWNGKVPMAANGLTPTALATGLDHPRWIYVLPNGDVLVAESNAPNDRTEEFKGFEGWGMKTVMKCIGDAVKSADRITVIPANGGKPTPYIEGLKSPFGMALVGNDLYVADTDELLRFTYTPSAKRIERKSGTRVVPLPAGNRNHHWTKNIIASRDGKKLYVTIGSNSDHGENSITDPHIEDGRAAIMEIDLPSGSMHSFADGLRNPNGLAWEPTTGVLWTVVNERDKLGNDLVPDYLTSVERDDFYGWPWWYYGDRRDGRVPGAPPAKKVKKPEYALGNHVAPLGLAFSEGEALPKEYRNGAFIGQHGSWNRRPFSGYDVVFVPFANGKPAPDAKPVRVLWGFRDEHDNALGRPVGVAIDKSGALLVADDVGNIIWRVAPSSGR
jgi:glucose/arabinose dehydrogenase